MAESVITLLIDGSGGDVEVRLFGDWPTAMRAFNAAVKEFDNPMEVEHRRGHWWAGGVDFVSTWVELKRIKVER